MQSSQAHVVEPQRLLNEIEVATFLGVSVEFLQADRAGKKRIAYLKIGRAVRYDPVDVVAFKNGCRVQALSQV